MSLELFMTSGSATKIRCFPIGLKRDKWYPTRELRPLHLELIALTMTRCFQEKPFAVVFLLLRMLHTPAWACGRLREIPAGTPAGIPVYSDPSWQAEKAKHLWLQATLTFFS